MLTLEQKQAVFTQIAKQAGNTPENANWLGIISSNFVELSDALRLQAISETQKMNLPDIANLLEGLHERYNQDMTHK